MQKSTLSKFLILIILLLSFSLSIKAESNNSAVLKLEDILSGIDYYHPSLKITELKRQEAKAQLNQKYIQAPFSGILGIPEVQLGEYITPGQQHIVSLQQIENLYLDFYIPEKYYKNIRVGENISFKTNQEKNYTHQAQIVAIQPAS